MCRNDARHGLQEVTSLDLVVEGGEKQGISVSSLLTFSCQSLPSFRKCMPSPPPPAFPAFRFSADRAVTHVTDKVQYYHPLRYFTVNRPMGVDFIGEVEIEDGKSLHSKSHLPPHHELPLSLTSLTVRCHKASSTAAATFHSIDTRPSGEGGAVFRTGDLLSWFDY